MIKATKSIDNVTQNLLAIEQKVVEDIRISSDECLYLYEHAELGFVGKLANLVRERKNGN